MRINHNISAMNTCRQMEVNSDTTSKSMEKLSSGLRINRAADDAAGLSISQKMRGQIAALNQATRNAQDGVSLIQTGEGALNEVSDMLTRMKELKVQSANGTYDTNDTGNINLELDALGSAIDKVLTNTSFNGIKMLDNSGITGGEDFGGVDITDESGNATIHVGQISFQGGLTSGTSIADVDTAINSVNTDRAQFGAYQNQLEHTVNNLNTTSENLSASESRIRDVDMATEMMNFTKNNILLQAAQSMLSQANQQPQSVLNLLRG